MTIQNLVREPLRTTPFVIERPRPFPEIHPRSQRYPAERMAALLQHKEKNAHRRILAVATVQQQLQTSRESEDFELAAYLRQLCEI